MNDNEIAAPVILVVEDQGLLRLEAVDLLMEAGFDVLDAPDARTALKILQGRPDVTVLFTDVEMPGEINGVDLAHEVNERWPLVQLLVTSAGKPVRNEDLPDDGSFLPKPYLARRCSRRYARRSRSTGRFPGQCAHSDLRLSELRAPLLGTHKGG